LKSKRNKSARKDQDIGKEINYRTMNLLEMKVNKRSFYLLLILLSVLFISCEPDNFILSKPSCPIRGLIVQLPGFGQTAKTFDKEIKLDTLAIQNGFLFVNLSLDGNLTDYYSVKSIQDMDNIINKVYKQFGLINQKLIVGGFSMGGTGAVKYAEYLIKNNKENKKRLAAVFCVDPPLDFEKQWDFYNRVITNKLNPIGITEAKNILKIMNNKLGGSPEKYYLNYRKSSPYTDSDLNGGNSIYLKKLPMRFYSEPDTLWWKLNRGYQPSDLNYSSIVKMVQKLRSIGNENVEIIETHNKGFRPNGTRHPHSWSIVDENDLIKWIQSQLIM
jgi:pimeloyl-ACP methyl ester carboxylesterase